MYYKAQVIDCQENKPLLVRLEDNREYLVKVPQWKREDKNITLNSSIEVKVIAHADQYAYYNE